ncbi:MAG TPA: hypothetical protein VFF68_04515 [Anaerolineaceae bacterium]|nr:hypothetical protein [Anaerolineaceae bacterium]
MEKVVAVFQSQAQADAAVDELTRTGLHDLGTAVYEGRSQDHPTGTDTIPVTGFTGVPGQTGAVPPFIPAGDAGLDFGDDENAEFLGRMYEQGATLVVVDYRDEDELKVAEILSKHGGRFSRED